VKYRKQSTHHIKSRSRGGSNNPDNLVIWDDTYHDAYHRLFKNLTLDEAIEMLRIVSIGGTEWDKNRLEALRQTLMSPGAQE